MSGAAGSEAASGGAAKRAVLVTGAGRRIGAAIARDLGAAGWHVFVHHNASAEEARGVVADIIGGGGSAETMGADLADPDQTQALIDRCGERAVALGLSFLALVNNASLFVNDQLETFDVTAWRKHMAINLLAPTILTRGFAKLVPDDAMGCVVNMLDNKVFALNPDFFTYTLSKVGLHGATQTMAMALAPKVRVCGVAPGIVLPSGKQTERGFQVARMKNPLGRGTEVAEIVAAVRFLIDTPAMNGQTITIDGGQALMKLPRDVAFL